MIFVLLWGGRFMLKKRSAFVFIVSFFWVTALAFGGSQDRRKSITSELEKVNDAIEVIDEMVRIPEEGIPDALLSKAYGIAIIPNVIKAAWVVGGRIGKGVLLVRNEKGQWGNPCFIRIAGGSVGWQIGIQSADIILVFKRKKSIESISEGKITLGADAAVAAGPVGRRAEVSTDIELEAEIYSYSKSKGLFAGVSVEGTAIQIDEDANAHFYDKEYLDAHDILFGGKKLRVPAVGQKLIKILTEYTSLKL
jgi:lipid-binding SYLF domain-containing protein